MLRTAAIIVSGRIDFVPPVALDSFGVVAFLKKSINLGALRQLIARLIKNPPLTREQFTSPFARLRALLG